MKGFGKSELNKSVEKHNKSGRQLLKAAVKAHTAGNIQIAEELYLKAIDSGFHHEIAFSNLGVIYKNTDRKQKALEIYKQAISVNPSFADAYANLGNLLRDLGNLDQALASTLKSLELNPDNHTAHMNLGGIYKDLDNLDQALASTLKSLELKPDNHTAHMNLGGIYKDLGNLDQALSSTLKSLELKPDNPDALSNLGGIYKDLGNLDQALTSTLKSIELKPESPNAQLNLGGIYKDLGNLNQALASTLKSLELKPDNPVAINNIKGLIDQLNLSQSNANNVTRAYELLLNQTEISHRKLSKIFLQAFLSTIQKGSTSDPIISDGNEAFKTLAADWRFRKSLTLMIPPSSEAEKFFTRLRKELLILAIQKGSIPPQLKLLTEALAAQCFLNEYVYATSQEEEQAVAQLIDAAAESQEAINQYLAIIGCYTAIHTTSLNPELIKNYPTPDFESKELITTQFKEPRQEKKIKASFQESSNITNTTSHLVQELYDENPYPRFKYSDYTASELAKPIVNAIELETTRKNLVFPEELSSLNANPKVLIAGCGTGSQVIESSRYKNAQITAIDLSSSSLAYAIRRTGEYEMSNITFKRMDLLNVSELGNMFDVIECSGVLHHMEQPAEGLSALVQQLKPGGYIILGLYSEIARKVIVDARKTIQTLGIESTPQSIREFRKKVLHAEFQELAPLQQIQDFYSVSTCRDLCFHIQEHRFTTDELKKLLASQRLIFCGFILPDQIKRLYQKQYPEDSDMNSLKNWGKFEKEHPSTFVGMYQFWAQKVETASRWNETDPGDH
ncbi:tetratricopeptide repeat protein [Prochlorococcus sp. MIT 1323]|uniref:tetratricopeptide repeat protein n=1 Tax=Prochlorococcus sp. MIT 1323 TaxID=3082526 RepID=UPI0039B6C6A2